MSRLIGRPFVVLPLVGQFGSHGPLSLNDPWRVNLASYAVRHMLLHWLAAYSLVGPSAGQSAQRASAVGRLASGHRIVTPVSRTTQHSTLHMPVPNSRLANTRAIVCVTLTVVKHWIKQPRNHFTSQWIRLVFLCYSHTIQSWRRFIPPQSLLCSILQLLSIQHYQYISYYAHIVFWNGV